MPDEAWDGCLLLLLSNMMFATQVMIFEYFSGSFGWSLLFVFLAHLILHKDIDRFESWLFKKLVGRPHKDFD